MDGVTHYFDLTDPEHPKETYQKHTGRQVNMMSQSWDGKRVYITSSLLSKWDKTGEDNEQVLRGYRWDGHALTNCVRSRLHEGEARSAASYEIHGEADRAGRACRRGEIIVSRARAEQLAAAGVSSGFRPPRFRLWIPGWPLHRAWSSRRRDPAPIVAEDPADHRCNAPRSVRATSAIIQCNDR